jgi:uncharacterized protein (DUF1330 family)
MRRMHEALQVTELDVRDPKGFAEYGRRVFPLMQEAGAEVLGVSLGELETVEGEERRTVWVVSRWPSREAFHSFFADDRYLPLRRSATRPRTRASCSSTRCGRKVLHSGCAPDGHPVPRFARTPWCNELLIWRITDEDS